MWDACKLLWSLFLGVFRSRASLALREQIIVLQRTAPKRLCFNTIERVIFVGLYRLFPNLRDALAVVRPDTAVGMVASQGPPALRRWPPPPRHVLVYTRLPNSDAEFEQSPWIHGAPHSGLARLILRINWRISSDTVGLPRRGFDAPSMSVTTSAPMPWLDKSIAAQAMEAVGSIL